MSLEERFDEVYYKHPEIVLILKKLYKSAYLSGGASVDGKPQADGYDWSGAYGDLLPTIKEEIIRHLEMVGPECPLGHVFLSPTGTACEKCGTSIEILNKIESIKENL